jgi:hypothetical protein
VRLKKRDIETCMNRGVRTRTIKIVQVGLAMIAILLACLPGPALAAASPGNWQVSTVYGDVRYYPFASVAFDKDNAPHVVFRNNMTRNILHVWQSDGEWTTEKVGPSAGTFTTSIAVGPDGDPSISYGDGIYFGNLMFAVKTAGSWARTIVARGSVADAGQFSSLALDRQGIPHIAYNDGQILATLYYATLNTTTSKWEFSLIDDDVPYTGDAGYSPSLKIDAGGHPYVAYISGRRKLDDHKAGRAQSHELLLPNVHGTITGPGLTGLSAYQLL